MVSSAATAIDDGAGPPPRAARVNLRPLRSQGPPLLKCLARDGLLEDGRRLPEALKVDRIPQPRILSNSLDHPRFAHLREVVGRQPEVTRDALCVLTIHPDLPANHPAQVAVIDAADLSCQGAERHLPLLKEPRELFGKRAITDFGACHRSQYRPEIGRQTV